MNSLLLWFGALLAAVLTALFAVPQFVDWTLYRGQFEAEASRLLGREVRVAGSVAVDILPTPRIAFDRVRIADVPLGPADLPGEPILRAERIELGLGISGFLRGDLEVTKVDIVNPDVRLSLAADGRGNWQTLVLQQGAPSFASSGLSIGAVSVRGGRLSVTGPDARDLFAFTNVDGDVETVGSGGLLRFRGTLDWAGERHDLRLSTADAEPGGLRIKAGLRALSSGNSLSFDGGLSDLARIPRINGELIAKMSAFGPATGSGGTSSGASASPAPGFEFRARVEGDGRGVKLDNAAIAFERDGQPQLVTGSIDVGWSKGVDVVASLQSRWLDVDRMTTGGTGLRPLDAAGTVTRKLDSMLPERGRFKADITVDQVTLGGEAISAVSVGLAGLDGRLAIERFDANLPGAAHLSVAGSASSDGNAFEGRMLLRANSATRLLGWAARDTSFASLGTDAPFVLAARLTTSGEAISLDDVDAEVAGQRLKGSMRRERGARPLTAITVRSQKLDIAGALPGILSPARIAGLVGGTADRDRSPLLGWFDPKTDDIALRLDVGRLTDGKSRLQDVSADLDVSAGNLSVRTLRFKAQGDLEAELSGNVTSAASAERRGAVGWQVIAPTAEAVTALTDSLGLTTDIKAVAARGHALPVRLAGTLTLPPDLGRNAELMLDGSAGATRMTATVRTSRQPDSWRDHPLEADIELFGPEAFQLAGLDGAGRKDPSAKLAMRFAGVPATGIMTKILARAGGAGAIAASFDGRIEAKSAAVTAAGIIDLDARDAGDLARLAGLPYAAAFRDAHLVGRIGLAVGPDGLTLALDRIKAAGATLSGSIVRKPSGAVAASLVTDRVAIRDLLAALTVPAAAPTMGPPTPGPWPDGTFDLAALLKHEGTLTLAARRLEVDTDAALQDATITAKLVPGRLEITSLTAAILEGKLTSSWSLAAGPAEVTLAGTIDVANADLAAAPAGRRAATGRVSGNLSVEGRGFGPRSLLQFVSGKGSLSLTDADIPGLAPASVRQSSQSFLASEAPPDAKVLATLLRDALQQASLPIGSKTVDVEVSGGALKLGQLQVDTPEASVTNRTTVDIASFDTVTEWRIAPKARDVGTKRREALPAVDVIFAGPAWSIARTEPDIRTDDLSRELSVRLMERDVEELERLRRLDEQRVREETERRNAFEAARAAEAAAQAAAAAAAATAPQPLASPGAQPSGPGAPQEVKSSELPPPQPAVPPAPKPAFPYPARPSSEPWWGTQFLYPTR